MSALVLDNARAWAEFIAQALHERLDLEEFESFVPHYHAEHPLHPTVLADLFLRPEPRNDSSLDPRIPQYLKVLTRLKYIDCASILKALYRYSTSHAQVNPPDPTGGSENGQAKAKPLRRWRSSYMYEEILFYSVTKVVAEGQAIRKPRDALEMVLIVIKWMKLFAAASTAFAAGAVMGDLQPPPLAQQQQQARDEMEAARAAFVALLLRVLEDTAVLRMLGLPSAKGTRRALGEGLASFVATIQDASQIATRLEHFRSNTLARFEQDLLQTGKGHGKKGRKGPLEEEEGASMEELLDPTVALESFVVPELVIANTRAGLYIYLNACLVGRPLIDDAALFAYLHNRYQGDVSTMAIDLILASFDVLANAVFRNEGQEAAHVLRSYLINKLPLLLSNLVASSYPPLRAEFCITEALGQVDTNAFPTLSGMFDDGRNNNALTDSVREDFCLACCLHGLVPETSIETLLGENTFQTLPEGGRYVKEDLVQQCTADSERMQGLIRQLDNMDGNVGAVCHALTEVLGQLCRNKETMSLKILCSQLAQKPLALDVMLLFEKPYNILHPLCELLDNWRYEEDQNEYQPIYEEFASILLLLFAFAHRYNLSPAGDLGIRSPDSFVAKILTKGHLPRPLEDLSAQEKEHMDGWVRGLFDTEGGGLGDELMSSCPPQDFYLLVSTLFQQIVLAFSTGYLSEESLRGGVEYVVDTFLLPSLVPAITFLANFLWVDRPQDQKAMVKILQLVVLPSSISNEAQTMLSSVLNIVAKPLEHALRAYQRREPASQEIEPLLRALKESIPLSRRTGVADHNELEAWTSTANGGLGAAVRHTMQGFVQWSLNPGINVMPTSYTHRQVIVALKLLGAKRVLGLVLEEIRQQTEAGSPSIVYDVATALVCAPDVTNDPQPPPIDLSAITGLDDQHRMPPPMQKRLGLREILGHEAENCARLQGTDPVVAEIVVRLYRKVESQMTQQAQVNEAAILQAGGLALAIEGAAAESIDEAMAAAAATAVVANPDGSISLDTTGLDLGSMGADMGLAGASSAGGSLDLGPDADLFSSLDMDWADGMDLT